MFLGKDNPFMTNAKNSLLLSLVLTLSFLLNGCTASTSSDEPASPVAQATDFAYIVSLDDKPDISVSGNEFEITTNNCGSRVSTLQSFSRSRQFQVTFAAEFSESLRGQLGGDIIVAGAEIEAEVGLALGVQVGSSETVQTERQIETPADSITIVKLRWEEIWQTGSVRIQYDDGDKIGDLPFRILTTINLSQVSVQDLPCGTLSSSGTESVSTLPTNEIERATTFPTVPASLVPVESPMPEPTNTLAPPPTPLPTATPAPTFLVNETHLVDAYRTALGSSSNTGVFIQAGDIVSIKYLYGEWWIGQSTSCSGYGSEQTPTDADGYLGRDGDRVEQLIGCSNPNMCRPMSSAAWGSLLGSIGENGALFPIGKELSFTAQTSGILYLRINYFNHNAVTGCPYGDGGNITVNVTVQAP